MYKRILGRLLSALAITATIAAFGIGTAGTAQASPDTATPETLLRYAARSDDAAFTQSGEGSRVLPEMTTYRTGPLHGDLTFSNPGGRTEQLSIYRHADLALQSQGTENGELGIVTINGSGDVKVEQVSILPPHFKLTISLDLTVTVQNPPWSKNTEASSIALYTSPDDPLELNADLTSPNPSQMNINPSGNAALYSGDRRTEDLISVQLDLEPIMADL